MKGAELSYVLQDHLGSTAGAVNTSGAVVSTVRYFSFGDCRNSTGNSPTAKLFTGQRLDNTGLYYYNARYYDPCIGRFISPDSIVQDFTNPQTLNRYSYCVNNPLKYTDPSGHYFETILDIISLAVDLYTFSDSPSWENGGYIVADIVSIALPVVPAGGQIARGIVHGDDIFKTFKSVTKYIDDLREAYNIGVKNPWSFRGKLQILTGMSDEMAKGLEAHHVLPQALKNKFTSRFRKDFDINNPLWGAWVKKGEHQKWSKQYQKDWENWLRDNPKITIEDVMKKAEELGKDPKYDFKVTWAE
jgi:RHS repeat-associated protein